MLEIVADACKDWGFFQVVNHDVDMEVVKRMRGAWREFFALPMEEKKVYANLPVTYEGYGSRLGVEKEAILDWNDYYFLNLFPSDIRNLDKWPKIPTDLRLVDLYQLKYLCIFQFIIVLYLSCSLGKEGFIYIFCYILLKLICPYLILFWYLCRETTEKYACQLISLCQVLLKAMSSGLGLEADYLLSAFGGTDGISATMRANYYPRCPQPELTLGIAAHSDPGGITLLLGDDNVEGTQVRKGDSWVTVQPVPGSFLVNVGDQIQVITVA
jgi:isopenicillin N synthase-like dioxygenase